MRRVRIVAVVLAVMAAAGCNRFGYDAHIESYDAPPGSAYLFASGWLRDALQGRRAPATPAFRWQVDGGSLSYAPVPSPDFGSRPDVDAALGPTSADVHGAVVAQGLARGRYRVCFDVVPYEAVDSPFEAIGCDDVDVPYDQFEHSALDVVEVSGTTVRASGWYSRILGTLSQYLDQVWFSIDGVGVQDPAVVTSVDRPDAVEVFGPAVRGLSVEATVAPGSHTVCIGIFRSITNTFSGTTACRDFTVS